MDTIDHTTMILAGGVVHTASRDLDVIHTVTITLNGATGGATVIIDGFIDADGIGEVTLNREIGVAPSGMGFDS